MAQRAAELFYLTRKPSIGKRLEEKRMKADHEEEGTGKKFRKM